MVENEFKILTDSLYKFYTSRENNIEVAREIYKPNRELKIEKCLTFQKCSSSEHFPTIHSFHGTFVPDK